MSKPRSLFDWLVVGAGPAGIAVIGKLLDAGVEGGKIAWIDPHFDAGDFGRKWAAVPGNTSVKLFMKYYKECKSFCFDEREKKFPIESRREDEKCLLEEAAAPLKWITGRLRSRVASFEGMAIALSLSEGRWEVKTETGSYFSKKVVLAIGSDPKSLSYPAHESIPLETALDPAKLAKCVKKKETIGVFGSSHSAILALANLVQAQVKGVINFYRSPHRYAVYLDDWILFDNTGLKGFSADWARENLDGKWPKNLRRVLLSDGHSLEESLAKCDRLIYATGFEKRKLPVLEQYDGLPYDDRTGVIAPGLFGVGIAFPEAKLDRLGRLEYGVGVWKFISYITQVLPFWLRY